MHFLCSNVYIRKFWWARITMWVEKSINFPCASFIMFLLGVTDKSWWQEALGYLHEQINLQCKSVLYLFVSQKRNLFRQKDSLTFLDFQQETVSTTIVFVVVIIFFCSFIALREVRLIKTGKEIDSHIYVRSRGRLSRTFCHAQRRSC